MKFSRRWAMPSHTTFAIKPIVELLARYIGKEDVVIDPFARDSEIGTWTNDLNPATKAQYHLPAEEFCEMLVKKGIIADVALHDPPYSARQIKECYDGIGLAVHQSDTQASHMHRIVRDDLDKILRPGGVAISFGWNSVGFGKCRGYTQEEILLVSHGGGHNDTIVVVERKVMVVSLAKDRARGIDSELSRQYNGSVALRRSFRRDRREGGLPRFTRRQQASFQVGSPRGVTTSPWRSSVLWEG